MKLYKRAEESWAYAQFAQPLKGIQKVVQECTKLETYVRKKVQQKYSKYATV